MFDLRCAVQALDVHSQWIEVEKNYTAVDLMYSSTWANMQHKNISRSTKRQLAALRSQRAQLAQKLEELSAEQVKLFGQAKQYVPLWSAVSFADAQTAFW